MQNNILLFSQRVNPLLNIGVVYSVIEGRVRDELFVLIGQLCGNDGIGVCDVMRSSLVNSELVAELRLTGASFTAS